MMFTYKDEELMNELKDDILENGQDTLIECIVRRFRNYDILVNYNFYIPLDDDWLDEEDIEDIKNTEFELKDDERKVLLTMIQALEILEQQANTINPILQEHIQGIILN